MRVISEDLGRELDLSRWEVDVDPCLARGFESTESESVLEREGSCVVLSISKRSRWSDITRNSFLRCPELRYLSDGHLEEQPSQGPEKRGIGLHL